MTKRAGDRTPEPPGGRAAERLRMFQEARGGGATPEIGKSDKVGRAPRRSAKRRKPGAKRDRRKR